MKWAAVAMVVLACACGNKKVEPEGDDNDYGCGKELADKIVPQLVKTLDGGDADAFHRATEHFEHGTMCGPDLAAVVRDWEQSLREPDVAQGNTKRRQLVVKMRDDAMARIPEANWEPAKKALTPLFEKVK